MFRRFVPTTVSRLSAVASTMSTRRWNADAATQAGGLPSGTAALATPNTSAKMDELAATYCQLTLKEITELQRLIFKKLGHSDNFYEQALLRGMGGGGGGGVVMAAAPAAAAAAAPAADAAAAAAAAPPPPKKAAAEKSTYDVHLKAFPADAKTKVIKEVKTVANLSIADAKGLVDKCPGVVGKNLPKDDAQKLKKLLEDLKAEVELI